MAAHLLRLRLAILGNALRGSRRRAAGVVAATLGAAAVTLVVARALGVARGSAPGGPHVATTLLGSLVLALFALVPLVTRWRDPLHPRAFGPLGIPPAVLARGLGVASLVSLPLLAVAVAAVASIVTFARSPGAAVVTVLGAALFVGTCALAARLASVAGDTLAAERRLSGAGAAVVVLVVLVVLPLVVLPAGLDWRRDGAGLAAGVAAWLRFTPLGAAASAGGDAARGEGGLAALELAIAAATLVLLWVGFVAAVRRLAVTSDRAGDGRRLPGLGWFGALSGLPIGAVAARSLTYWARDPRYWVSLVPIPFVAVVAVIALSVAGAPPALVALLPLPLMCLLLGWSVHDDVAYDGTAVWLHVVSGVSGLADRLGRLVPVLVVGIPLVAVGVVLTGVAHGSASVVPAVLGASTAVLLAALGVSSVVSALVPYPTTRPGDPAFSQPQTAGASGALVQAASLVASALVASPALAVAFASVGDPRLSPRALTTGLVVGVVALLVGVGIGAAIYRRRQPEILAVAVMGE